jgi:hypothetical protein
VRLEGLSQMKNPMTSGIKPATFRLAAQCVNQLRYRVQTRTNTQKAANAINAT